VRNENEEERALSAARGGAEKRAYIQQIFSEIAPRYDLLNHVLSFNVDKTWRPRAIRELNIERKPAGTYLDICAGTLDVSVAIAKSAGFRGRVIGADFAEPMLRHGVNKIGTLNIDAVTADALKLPLADSSISGAIVSFGIRNVADLDACLVETYRVLEPGAAFVILEFSTPKSSLIAGAYRLYSNHILSRIGRIVSGHPTAYKYLPKSVENFPDQDVLAARMSAAGFTNVSWRSLTFGVAAIHRGEKRA
jgi:demethylmenaquinone methyltransferase/2-methoxy-6-polyprenyl-1,4-benzoquinol methylase